MVSRCGSIACVCPDHICDGLKLMMLGGVMLGGVWSSIQHQSLGRVGCGRWWLLLPLLQGCPVCTLVVDAAFLPVLLQALPTMYCWARLHGWLVSS